jgi:hypothetical protein
VLALLLVTVAWAAPVQAQQQNTPTTHVGQINTPDGRVLVGMVLDPDGWASVAAVSENDSWNAQHARWFRGRVINGQFTGTADDGTTMTAQRSGGTVTGQVAGQQFTITPVPGNGTAGVYRGGNGQDIVLVIEAPDGTRIARVWDRTSGQHKRTITLPPNTSSGSSSDNASSLSLLSLDVHNQQGGPGGMGQGSISNNANGSLSVSSGDASWNVSWCSSSFCG